MQREKGMHNGALGPASEANRFHQPCHSGLPGKHFIPKHLFLEVAKQSICAVYYPLWTEMNICNDDLKSFYGKKRNPNVFYLNNLRDL